MGARRMDISVTVRLIRSFEYRNIKPIVLKAVDLDQSVSDFKALVNAEILSRSSISPVFRKHSYDTMKIQHIAHKSKTSDPVINTENDEKLILCETSTLKECGVGHETEISYFKREEYEKYKANPVLKW